MMTLFPVIVLPIMLAASIFCPALTFSKLHHIAYTHRRSNNSPLFFSVGPSEASLIAGGLGGACGVGLSFPLDSLVRKLFFRLDMIRKHLSQAETNFSSTFSSPCFGNVKP